MRELLKLILYIFCCLQFKVAFGQMVAVQVNINKKQTPNLYGDVDTIIRST